MARDDFYDSPCGAAYSTYMERPRLSSRISRLVWGGDSRTYYESMAAAIEVLDGGTIVDCPCGAGPALRAIPVGRDVRYVGVDLSPAMLRRARERAIARGLTGAEFVEADAADDPVAIRDRRPLLLILGPALLPRPAGGDDRAGSPPQAGGRLVGSSFVRGQDTLRQRLLIRPHVGDFGPLGTQPEIESWLAAAESRADQLEALRPDAVLRRAQAGLGGTSETRVCDWRAPDQAGQGRREAE